MFLIKVRVAEIQFESGLHFISADIPEFTAHFKMSGNSKLMLGECFFR